MLTLLIGKDWIANRDAMLEMIAQDITQEKRGRILIVPELISHDTERRLSAAAGDTTSRFAEVLSFTRMVRRVADFVGHPVEDCLDNGGRVVAMASATRQLHSRLKAYAAVESKPEFLVGLIEAVDEFKRCCITSADLKAASEQTEGSLSQKLEELALVLECYDGLCLRGKRDPRDQMSWLIDELESSSYAKEHVFYIDGFPDFTRQHAAILEHLIKESSNVTISINCDQIDSQLLTFEKAGKTAGDLLRIAKKNGIETAVRIIPAREDDLSVVCSRLFQGRLDQRVTTDVLTLHRTDSVYHECLCAAEQIIKLVQNGSRYKDIGLVCTDLNGYKDTLSMMLDRCHIPSYLSGTEPINEKAVIISVLSALDAALGGFERQDVLRYLKSAISPIKSDVCDCIENYTMLWGINGSGWLKQWNFHPKGLESAWSDSARAELDALNNARITALQPLIELRNSFRDASRLAEQVQAIYDFLNTIHLDQKLDQLAREFDQLGDNRSAQILDQLWEVLINALEQLYDVLGDTAWDTDTFTRLFKLLLSQYDVGTIPPVLDAIMVGTTSSMRCQQVKHLLVLGVTEGNLPGYSGSTGVLTDQERTALRTIGIPLTGGSLEGIQAEYAEIYGTFCGAQETIYVSYSGSQPSFVYRRLLEICGDETYGSYNLGAALVDSVEAGAYLARFNAVNEAKEAGVYDQYAHVKKCTEHQLGNVSFENICGLYGKKLNLSASQIDKLADCRYHYFLRYGLRIKELKPITVDPAEFGTYVHAVLENTAREVLEKGGFHKVSKEKTLEIGRKFSNRYAAERFGLLSAERANYLFKRNSQELDLIVEELWYELHSISFAPVGFEVAFGDECEMPAITFSGKSMQAQLRGFVDRVDGWSINDQNYFRVVDYKTGRKDFDYCDVFNGLGLQMLLYMFALQEHGQTLLGDQPISAGVQYFPARVPFVSTQGHVADEETESIRLKSWKRKGLLLSNEHVLNAMESEDGQHRMPYTRRKDGTIVGDIADCEQFKMLKTYVFSLLGKMVDNIASGDVAPNPYMRGSSHCACAFCPYSIACHKSGVENVRNYQAMTAQRFWEEVEKEVTHRGN